MPEEYYPTSTAFEQGCGVAAGTDPFHTNASELCPGMEFTIQRDGYPSVTTPLDDAASILTWN